MQSRDAEFYNSLGTASAEIGQYDKALIYFNKAIEINPNLADAYSNRGIVYAEIGQYDEAMTDFNKAV